MAKKGNSLGFGDHADTITKNYDGKDGWMVPTNRGTLKINPEFKDATLEDILEKADLAFGVMAIQTMYTSPVIGKIYPSGAYSVIRVDNDAELGTGFKDGYYAMSYVEILDTFFQGTKQLGGIPTRAINFHGGKIAAIQLILPDDFWVGDLLHKTWMNFYSSHDGTYSVTGNTGDIPIICGNTFAASFSETMLKFSIKHTENLPNRLNEIASTMMQLKPAQEFYYNLLNKAIAKPAESNIVKEFLFAMVPDTKTEDGKRKNDGPANQREALNMSIGANAGLRNSGIVTYYDLLQGMTYYNSNVRIQKRDEDEQFMYVNTGPGAKQNAKAYDWLKEAMK